MQLDKFLLPVTLNKIASMHGKACTVRGSLEYFSQALKRLPVFRQSCRLLYLTLLTLQIEEANLSSQAASDRGLLILHLLWELSKSFKVEKLSKNLKSIVQGLTAASHYGPLSFKS